MSTALGTLTTEFRRAYYCTNPYLVKGLDIWRLTNCPPALPDDYYDIFGLLPIVVENFADPQPLSNLSFDLLSLKGVNEESMNLTSYLEPILRVLREGPDGGVTPPIMEGIPPIFTYQLGKGILVTFNIEKLEYAEVHTVRRIPVVVNPYNRSSYVNISTEPPLYQQNTTDTVSLNFDLTNLDYA